jgi:exosortase
MSVVDNPPRSPVNGWMFSAAAVLTVLLIGRGLATAWTAAPDLGHGWAIPWLAGWLVWERLSLAGTANTGSSVAAERPGAWLWCALAAAVIVYAGLRLFLEPFPLWPSLLWLLAGGLYAFGLAVAWLGGGRDWVKRLAGPLALVFTGIPWPSAVENTVLLPMRQGIAEGVAEVLNLFSIPAFAEGAAIRIAGGMVGVDEACGGMRSLQTALMIAWFMGELVRMRAGRRIVLLAGAVGAAVAGNFLRALMLTWLMDQGGQELFDQWHDPAGYLALICSLAVVVGLGWWWRSQTPVPVVAQRIVVKPARRAVAWVVVALAACGVVEAGVHAWYGTRENIAANVVDWGISWPRHEPQFQTFPLSARAREMLLPDEYSSSAWRLADGRERMGYFIAWNTGQQARNMPFLHGPEVCLPMSGIKLIRRREPVEIELGGVVMPFEAYEFLEYGRPLYVFRVVWNPDEGRAVGETRGGNGRGRWLGERWEDVAERRIAVRARILTLGLAGEASYEDAVEAFRTEAARVIAR